MSAAAGPALSPWVSIGHEAIDCRLERAFREKPKWQNESECSLCIRYDTIRRPAVRCSLTGLWCNGGTCFGSACSVDVLLDENTVLTLGILPMCTWKDGRTVTVVFGTGEVSIDQVQKVPRIHRRIFCVNFIFCSHGFFHLPPKRSLQSYSP